MPYINQNQVASSIPFDNAGTGLVASTVQTAIAEVQSNIVGSIPAHASTHLPDGTDPLTTAAPVTLNPDVANTTGTANAFARADHIHNVPADVPVSTNTVNAEGNSTSFARANHTHNTVLANQSISATANATTTSNTAVLLTGMTLTTAVAGTYLIMSNVVFVAAGNANATVALYKGGVLITGTNGVYARNANNPMTHAGFTVQTLAANDVIEIRWNTSGGTQLTANLRSLALIRLG